MAAWADSSVTILEHGERALKPFRLVNHLVNPTSHTLGAKQYAVTVASPMGQFPGTHDELFGIAATQRTRAAAVAFLGNGHRHPSATHFVATREAAGPVAMTSRLNSAIGGSPNFRLAFHGKEQTPLCRTVAAPIRFAPDVPSDGGRCENTVFVGLTAHATA